MTQDQFAEDKRTQQAVILYLLAIGEAASHIAREYPDFLEQNADLRTHHHHQDTARPPW